MKKITLIVLMIWSTNSFSQVFPIDFSDPSDAMNCFDCTFTLTTDAGNDVGQVAGGGLAFDTAQLNLAENLDLSDDANNTITFRIKAIADYGTRTHLLKFEGGSGPNTELSFTTSGTAWQDITLDYGSGLGNYDLLVLFTDFNNTDSGTYLIDDFAGGTNVPPPPSPQTPAPTPTTPDNEVLVVYGDTGGYTNIWVSDYSFGGSEIIDLDASASVNESIKMDFSCCGYGEGTNPGVVTDLSAYDYLQFDYWSNAATQIRFILIEEDGAVNEFFYELPTEEAFVFDQWTHVEIPLSFFENLGFSKDKFFQYKLGTLSDLDVGIVYFDNIYFSTNPLSVNDFVKTKFKVYPNPTQHSWNLLANENIISIQLFDVLGKEVLFLKPNSNQVNLEASKIVNGLYFAKIYTDKGLHTQKLIKK